MRENRLRRLWGEGEAALGGWLQIADTFAAETMAHQGWDTLTIDMQHGAIDYHAALSMLQAISTTDGGAYGARTLARSRDHHEDAGCRRLRHHLPDGQ